MVRTSTSYNVAIFFCVSHTFRVARLDRLNVFADFTSKGTYPQPFPCFSRLWEHIHKTGIYTLTCISIVCCIFEILFFQPLFFFFSFRNINSLNFEDNRSCTVIATGNHHSLIVCPLMHN